MTVTFPQVLQRLAPLGGPLAGRAAEMEALRQAWHEAVEGRTRIVLLAGEAGVGKTRLAAELAGEVDDEGAAVLFGSCPVGGAEPYHPLVEALGPVPVDERDPDRDAIFETLGAGLAARARRTPMLLVLDDLHRADRSTLLALRRILDAADGAPLLVVATYRDAAVDRSHPLSDFLLAVLPRPGVVRINLEGLGSDALVEMVGDPELAGRLWRQSEGNPVRVGELLRLGGLDRPLPPSFDELVALRMEALRPAVRKLLRAAAVCGSEFRVDVAAEASGLPAERVPSALKQLAAAGFIVDEHAAPGDVRRFVHDMVREAVDRGLEPVDRVRLHQRVGHALDTGPAATSTPAALLAWHYMAAAPVGGSAVALLHARRAGDRAMELMAWEEATVHYGHALAAARGVDASVRADLLLALGEAQRLAGETARARQAFLEAAALAREAKDGGRVAQAALALGQVSAVWGADPELEQLAGEARALLGQEAAAPMPSSATPVFTDFASDALYDVLDGEAAPAANLKPAPAARAAAAKPAPADPAAAAALLRARHVAMAGPEHAADRFATAQEMLALAARAGDDELAATGRGWRLVDGLVLGRLEDAASDRAVHADLALRLADPRPASDALAWTAMVAMLDGHVDEARSAADEAYALGVEAGDPEADESFLLQRWWLALEWGTSSERAAIANECRAQASAGHARAWRASASLALARDGRLEEAAEELRRVTGHGLGELIRDQGRLHPLSCIAEVAWILGDAHRAGNVGPLLEPFADLMVLAGRARAWRGSVARACGMVAATCHRFEDAEASFEAAMAVHRRMGALPLLARTRYEWSKVLLERGRKGDKRRAADSRRKAAELAKRFGMSRLLEEIAVTAT